MKGVAMLDTLSATVGYHDYESERLAFDLGLATFGDVHDHHGTTRDRAAIPPIGHVRGVDVHGVAVGP